MELLHTLKQQYLKRKNEEGCQITSEDELLLELLTDLAEAKRENEAMRQFAVDTKSNVALEDTVFGRITEMIQARLNYGFYRIHGHASHLKENRERLVLQTERVRRVQTFEADEEDQLSPKGKPPSPVKLLTLPNLSKTENIPEEQRTYRDHPSSSPP